MTKDQRAALEQVAREFCDEYVDIDHCVTYEAVPALVTLLAAQRAAVLEEVAIPIVDSRCIGFAKDDEPYELIINELRQAAQEQRS